MTGVLLVDFIVSSVAALGLLCVAIRVVLWYVSAKGVIQDLHLGMCSLFGAFLCSLNCLAAWTGAVGQDLSILYCSAHMIVLSYFSLVVLYNSTLRDSPRYKQFIRIGTVVVLAGVLIYLCSIPRETFGEASPALMVQLDSLSKVSIIPNLVFFGYLSALGVSMLVYLQRTRLSLAYRLAYWSLIGVAIGVTVNAALVILHFGLDPIDPVTAFLLGPFRGAKLAQVNGLVQIFYRALYIACLVVCLKAVHDGSNLEKLRERGEKKNRKMETRLRKHLK